MAEFSVHARALDSRGRTERFPLRPAWLVRVWQGSECRAPDEAQAGALDVEVYRASGSRFVVRGMVHTTLHLPCSRCLNEVALPVELPLYVVFAPGADRRGLWGEGDGDDDDALDLYRYKGDTLVLDEVVREQLLLAIPMQVHCPSDCAGLSQPPVSTDSEAATAQPEASVDPRFAALAKIRLKGSAPAASRSEKWQSPNAEPVVPSATNGARNTTK
ncbi:MAG: YceD family protein [Polyangiales bacterium]